MAANTSISLSSLDFDTLKSNFISFLQAQPQFADYNFTGANINVLLDILSYNTYLNAFYLNMVASEMFLDSAQLPSSVISHAKSINYTPRSYKSSLAVLNLVFAQNGLNVFVIPQGTRFSGQNSNGNFTYVTRNSSTLYPTGGNFYANGINVYEGKYVNDTFVVDNTIDNQRFNLTNVNVDTDSLTVTVVENNGANTTVFNPTTSLFGLTNISNVYFIQATSNSGYEIVFGDGVFGRAPLNGATILSNYMITSGSDGNGSNTFNLSDNLGAFNGFTSSIIPSINVSNSSFNGANNEGIESIRFNAPRNYQTQENAITTNDYKQIILQNYSDIKSVHVYGGETVNTSIQFGKVFIVPATYAGYNLSSNEKTDIINFLLKRNVLGITPIIVDPTYLYLDVFSSVKYDNNQTTYSPSDIQNLIASTILSYNSVNLEDFDTEFKLSDFMGAISNTDGSISSNETYVVMKKIISPQLNSSSSINVVFNNAITPGSFYSSSFLSNGVTYKFTDYNPNLNTFTLLQSVSGLVINNNSNVLYLQSTSSSGQATYSSIGTLNYTNGSVNIGQIVINDFLNNNGIIFYATAVEENVTSMNNDILSIDIENGINITVIPTNG